MSNNHEYILELIDISRNDLDSSMILYKKKKYPQAIYLLQQSVEKACKALASMLYNLSFEELPKNIGHESIVAFLFPIRDAWKLIVDIGKIVATLTENEEKFEEILNQSFEDEPIIKHLLLDNFPKIRKRFRQMSEEIALMNSHEIEEFLGLIRIFNIHMEQFSPICSLILTKVIDFNDSVKFILAEKISNLIYYWKEPIIKIMSFTLFAYLTYPHFLYTRYPTDRLSPKDYNQDMGIVKSYLLLWNHVNESLNKLTENLFLLYTSSN